MPTILLYNRLRNVRFFRNLLDNSPLELEDWEKSQVGHPRYYSTVAALETWAWGIAVVGSLPWLWYFLLVRITEIASAFRGDAASPTEKKD